MNEWLWYGVFDNKGDLVDVSPGEHHAGEVTKDLAAKTKKWYRVAPVKIKEITNG